MYVHTILVPTMPCVSLNMFVILQWSSLTSADYYSVVYYAYVLFDNMHLLCVGVQSAEMTSTMINRFECDDIGGIFNFC